MRMSGARAENTEGELMAHEGHSQDAGSTSYGAGYALGAAVLVIWLIVDFVWVITTSLSTH